MNIIFMVSLLGMRKITIFKKMSGHNWKRLFSSWNQNSPKYISRVFSKFCAAKVPFLTKFRIQNFAHFFWLCIREKIFTWWQSHKKTNTFRTANVIHAKKTLWIKHVNRDSGEFASNSRQIRWIVWTAFKFSGQFLNLISGQFLDCLDSLWIGEGCKQKIEKRPFTIPGGTVSRLSGQFLDCPDSFQVVRTVSGLSGQFLDCPDSF